MKKRKTTGRWRYRQTLIRIFLVGDFSILVVFNGERPRSDILRRSETLLPIVNILHLRRCDHDAASVIYLDLLFIAISLVVLLQFQLDEADRLD